jgi:hypothetical protein
LREAKVDFPYLYQVAFSCRHFFETSLLSSLDLLFAWRSTDS